MVKFNYDLTSLSQTFFKEIARICDEKSVHKKMGKISRQLVKQLRVQEITGLPLSDAFKVIEDFINNYIGNLSQRENF